MRRLVLLVLCGISAFVGFDAEALAGSVEGIVTPVEWAREVEVCVVEAQPSENCTTPTAGGSYNLDTVPSGARIEFAPSFRSRLLKQYYNHKSSLSEADVVVPPKEAPLTGVDGDLVEGGAIEGTVTAAGGGEPLAEVEVCAVSISSPDVRRCGETDAGGEYELHSLPSDLYRVGFWGQGASAEYEPLYFQGESSSAGATPVAVTAGSTTAEIDGALARGAQIRGVVTALAGGRPLEGIAICLFASTGSRPQRCTYSGETGGYAFEGLVSGTYQLGFSLDPAETAGEGAPGEDDGFATQYFDGVSARAQAATISLISPAIVEGVDAALAVPPAPPAPAPAPLVVTPTIGAAPIAVAPHPANAADCKKGYRKRKVKGKAGCVKTVKRRSRRDHKGGKRHRGHRGGRNRNGGTVGA